MLKYILLLTLPIAANAQQTNQEIIDYCKKTMLKDWGYAVVLECVKEELKARDEITELSKKK